MKVLLFLFLLGSSQTPALDNSEFTGPGAMQRCEATGEALAKKFTKNGTVVLFHCVLKGLE